MISPHLDFRYLKRLVSIERVLADQGLLTHLRRRGDRLVGPCPVHGGDNPNAFTVSLSKNAWRCFTGCNAGGDVVELARRLHSDSYRQAAAYLSSLAGHVETSPRPSPPPREPFRPFRRRLPLDPTDPWLRAKGIHPATAHWFEAGAHHGHGFLRGCIGVRLHDPQGRPLGYAGRRLDPAEAAHWGKWKLARHFPKNDILFNFHRVADHLDHGVVVTECPWSVLRLAQLCIPAVALLGTNLSSLQQRLLAQAPTVAIMMDGDPAGAEATALLSRRLEGHTPCIPIHLPEGLDPDDLDDHALAAAACPLFSSNQSK